MLGLVHLGICLKIDLICKNLPGLSFCFWSSKKWCAKFGLLIVDNMKDLILLCLEIYEHDAVWCFQILMFKFGWWNQSSEGLFWSFWIHNVCFKKEVFSKLPEILMSTWCLIILEYVWEITYFAKVCQIWGFVVGQSRKLMCSSFWLKFGSIWTCLLDLLEYVV